MNRLYRPLPSQERLRKDFIYDPETGLVERRGWIGPCGTKTKSGYLTVVAAGQPYYLHRLIWMWQTGQDPAEKLIDHIDRNKSNNKWENLRLVCEKGNMLNKEARGWRLTPSGKYRVTHRGRHIGMFDTPEEATSAYLEAKRLSWVELTG